LCQCQHPKITREHSQKLVQTLFDKKKEKKEKKAKQREEKDVDSREVEIESPHGGSPPPLPLNDSKDSTVMMVSNL